MENNLALINILYNNNKHKLPGSLDCNKKPFGKQNYIINNTIFKIIKIIPSKYEEEKDLLQKNLEIVLKFRLYK